MSTNLENKKAIRKRITELTSLPKWQENDETIAEVQELGKKLSGEEKIVYRKPSMIAIWHGDRILVTGTAEQLSEITGLSKQTIWTRVREMRVDSKGRQFKHYEKETNEQ
ncbi:hypothetical protein IGK28_001742 [Enterococcus sp. DIV0182]|uniref:hypothetical protein n=1 Tax=unclassified Enterococcus TaxID=2608891 RepID=UPI000A355987|nr:hypothetical protein [Enterococcus sp. 5B7_DIV0075]OTP23836.1 hypothetical protein A5800_001693 [Enterococcus sp. 5B7_DIV0075]